MKDEVATNHEPSPINHQPSAPPTINHPPSPINHEPSPIPHSLVWAALYFGVGAALWFVTSGMFTGRLSGWLRLGFDKVGITSIALLPLALWGTWTALGSQRNADRTLSYIGATAQRFGLLGTVIGIVAATVRIGASMQSGAATAVTGALPAVGQALVSTAVGFVIAIACDFFRYLQADG